MPLHCPKAVLVMAEGCHRYRLSCGNYACPGSVPVARIVGFEAGGRDADHLSLAIGE